MHNDTGTEWKLIASLRCGYSGVGAPSALETQQIIEWVRTGRIEMDFCVNKQVCDIYKHIHFPLWLATESFPQCIRHE